ncbi:MAG: hypothetical protein HY694_07050 [Deltaproteobacteria bacterium]|nr:hypothetical protein [Deltaproteobacteria bacterium]
MAGFKEITVTAGKLGAFECKCRCSVIAAGAIYEPDCGEWTFWYAPQAKNIIKTKTESTASTMELVQYRVSDVTPSRQVPQEKVPQRTEQLPARAEPAARPALKAEKPEWKVGYEWTYAWKRPGRSGTYTNEVIREDLFEGVPSYVVRSGKNENYYARNVLGIFARMSGGKLIFKRDKPRQNLSWPLEVGKEWRNSYLRENIQEKSSQTFDYRMVVAKIEEVKVPAGTFEAFKVEVYVYHSGNLFAEYWYSPKVKWLVKERESLQDGLRETELMSFKVD